MTYMPKIKEKEQDATDFQDIDDMAVEEWVLVKVLDKKTIKQFVGQVTDFDTGEPIIKFRGKQFNFDEAITFKYCSKADVSSTEKKDEVTFSHPNSK
ncbi:hypothetical protein JTB14_021672 [Gonioctena quinquepunctata]|nr:hypothetical protein JTB14_021672 [Gonioctena quinquepunctata]